MAGAAPTLHYWVDLQSVHGFRCYDNTRRRASTSMYSLAFRVRVMLQWQRNPCTDCKFAQ